MTELKTLKDLDIYAEFSANTRDKISIQKLNLISADELKQEAIKWVKYFDAETWASCNYEGGWENKPFKIECVDCDSYQIKEFLTYFFNLTEADIQLNEKSEEK